MKKCSCGIRWYGWPEHATCNICGGSIGDGMKSRPRSYDLPKCSPLVQTSRHVVVSVRPPIHVPGEGTLLVSCLSETEK